jgi:hypothetical protein
MGIIACKSYRISDVLSARPDLRHLLTLPQGTLAVLGGAGIEAVYDSQGQDHWGAALAAEAKEAAPQEPGPDAHKPTP